MMQSRSKMLLTAHWAQVSKEWSSADEVAFSLRSRLVRANCWGDDAAQDMTVSDR